MSESQEPAEARAHEAALARSHEDAPGVVPADWIARMQEMARTLSRRDRLPVESMDIVLKKDGSLASLQIQFPTAKDRTPNDARQSHRVATAQYHPGEGKLKLSAADTLIDGPDLYELCESDQLPTVCGELAAIRRLQRAFAAHGLNYALEARLIPAPRGKSWAWEIGPAEEQMPNVIYGMIYYPATGELRTIPIERAKVAAKVQAAATGAGMRFMTVKDMADR